MLNDLNVNFNNITNVEDFNFRVDNYYATLFKILCSQNQDRKANKLTNHPQGAKAGYNHSNISSTNNTNIAQQYNIDINQEIWSYIYQSMNDNTNNNNGH
jgi:hypothetical protein